MSPGRPWPAQMRSRIVSIRRVPSRQGVHFPQDSSAVKARKYLATSTMHDSSSSTTMPPEPMIDPASASFS